MVFEKLASAIRNNVLSGLLGYHLNMSFTLELIEDDIIDTRIQLIFQLVNSGLFPLKDMLLEINCIKIDCKDIEKCSCCNWMPGTPTMHFEIPQTFSGLTGNLIEYIGSPDKLNPFAIYTSAKLWQLNKYRRRKNKHRPYVFIDTTPNENGMYDCFVFNAPLLRSVSVVAVFKDPRLLESYGCCDALNDNMNPLNAQIKEILSLQYLKYYRANLANMLPNTLTTVV